MIVAFPMCAEEGKYWGGIQVEDGEFVGQVASWYDNCLWEGAYDSL
jgi:hypothetical protein